MAITYNSPYDYIMSVTSTTDKIKKIDEVIEGLLAAQLLGASSSDVLEYQVNTGQSIVKAIYRNPSEIANAINALEKLRNIYQFRITGRIRRNQNADIK